MLDEFAALGRLDFFESQLAFMAGYGIRSFLITQSLNQLERAYGPNHAILDNCHIRVAFSTNDERTAKRVSDALGTATEMRAMKNYAGHRLSPWLGHLMVSRQEQPRPKYHFERGDDVRVIDGPFGGFNGVVEDVNYDKGKLRVSVSIFGRQTPVELDFVQVSKN